MRLIFIFTFSFLFLQNNFSQQPPVTEQQAEQELSERGITDEEFRARMNQKGYDLDNIRPEQVPQLEGVIQETLNELEKEKTAEIKEDTRGLDEVIEGQAQEAVEEAAKNQARQSADEIDEAVREGASLEEAISEELNEAAKNDDPPAIIYGQNIFRNQSLEVYRSAKDIKPPSTYVLGPGDEIVVSIFGISQAEFVFTINENGYIQPSQMPRIYLKGISLKKAESLIRQRYSQFYVFQPEQFSLTVNTARTITINIFGEVETFGSFTISAINTAFNALVASGGPTDIGTIRNIKLIRGRETKVIDVYKFLFDPRTQYDFFLQNNDIIHVPTSQKLVSISGGIKRPFKYELLDNEDLMTLIKFAGGLTVNAYKENIQVTRIINEQKVIIDVNLNDLINNNTDFSLINGDAIKIRQIPGRLESYTNIGGAVEFPGRYELTINMRISDLLKKGRLREDARTDIAFVLRTMADETIRLLKINIDSVLQNPNSAANIVLQRKDKLTINSQRKYIDKYSISVRGAVRNPITYPFDPTGTITVHDAILLAGGLKPNATEIGYIKRTSSTNSKLFDYIPINVFDAVSNENSAENLKLKPKDLLTIYKTERYTDGAQVSITGAVRDPGSFDYDSDFKVSDIIFLSGGLKQDAAEIGYVKRTNPINSKLIDYIPINLKEALVNNNSIENILLNPKDRLTIYTTEQFTDAAKVSISGAVRNPATFDYDSDLRISDVIYLSGGLKQEATNFAYIIRTDISNSKLIEYQRVDLDAALANQKSVNDPILLPLDRIQIMSKSDFTDAFSVSVEGAVRSPGSYKYDKSLQLKDVLTMAGGLQLKAASNKIDIFRVVITKNQPTKTIIATIEVDENYNITAGGNFNLEPFDIIVARTVPGFELQRMVRIEGEVLFPGTYALIDENEKLSNIISRAGGLSSEAFVAGAGLRRNEDGVGIVILDLKKAMRRNKSRYNYVLKEGDVITIPKTKDLVTMNLKATLANELYPDRFLGDGKINVAYKKGKYAKWYVNQYLGGIARNQRARNRFITVEHPNGEFKRSKMFLGTPLVREGSIISVGTKPSKAPKSEKSRNPIDWGKVISDTVAFAGSVLTVLVLATKL